MKRHQPHGVARCAAVWITATVGLGGLAAWVLPDLADARRVLGDAGPAGQSFDHLLVWLCSAVAFGSVCWLWAVTTVVTLEAVRGRRQSAVPGIPTALRRLVLAACGVALAGGVTVPAVATPGQPHEDRSGPATVSIIEGLPLPDRATGAIPGGGRLAQRASLSHLGDTRGRVVVVQPGDTLWILAARQLPSTADAAQVTARWHRIYDLNRTVIGADPDVIHPDQRLRLPRR